MATVQELERALINADKAGDTDAARKIAAVLLRSKSDVVSQIPDMQVQETMPKQVEPTIAESAVGAGEAALTLGTGAVGGTLGMLILIATGEPNRLIHF